MLVGTRLARHRHTGTLLYEGPLPPYPGTFYGIAWDSAEHGKHDGTAPDGTRYFACAPGHGTYLAATARIEWGVTFVDALREKYGDRSDLRTVSLVGPPPRGPSDPSCVYVAKAVPDGYDGALPRTITTLDLSRSLLSSWNEVVRIVRDMPLTSLTLQHVRLRPAACVPGVFAHLEHLSLGDSGTDWAQMAVLARAMPRLASIELARNGITTLASVDVHMPHVHTLQLEGNALGAWPDVLRGVRRLPRLQKLVLTGNPLERMPRASAPTLPALCDVHVDDTPLDWDDVQALETHLASPAWSLVYHRDDRIEAIGRLARLTCLNHTPITPEERVDAERYYIRRPRPGDARYEALVRVHGPPAPASVASMHDKLLTISYVHAATPYEAAWDKATSLALLKTMPMRLVQRRLVQLCGASPSAAIWAVLRSDREPIVIPLDDMMRDLAWFGVASGDMLVVVD